VVQKSLDPEWNEVFVILLADMPGDLFLDVFDYDLIGSNDFLGRSLSLSFSSLLSLQVLEGP